MSDDNALELSRRKALGALGTIGVAAAGAGAGTTAFLNDEESFDGNSVQAGTLDLTVGYELSVDPAAAVGSGQITKSGSIDGSPAKKSYVLEDVKPGDSGELDFDFSVAENPGYLTVSGTVTNLDENGTPEPEGWTPAEWSGVVELARTIRATLRYYDTSDESDGSVITEGTLFGVLRDLEYGVPLSNDGDPTTGVLNRSDFGSDAGSNQGLRLEWTLPKTVGNEIQSASVTLDVDFASEQIRNNGTPFNGDSAVSTPSGSGT